MNTCTDDTPIHLPKPEGYLSSAVAATSGCGMGDSPWVLQAPAGQRLALTLLDFNYGRSSHHSPIISDSHCDAYAVIDDVTAQRRVNVCPSLTRTTHVMTSENNTVRVTFRRSQQGREVTYVVLHFEGIIMKGQRRFGGDQGVGMVIVYIERGKLPWEVMSPVEAWLWVGLTHHTTCLFASSYVT